MENDPILAGKDRTIRIRLVLLAFILFTVFVFSMVCLATNPATTVSLLAYAAGLSIITLPPCTFPLVFVIMGKGYREGFLMALIFGLRLTVTITLYAIFIAFADLWLGMDETTAIMYVIAGAAVLFFVKLMKFAIPRFGRGIPQFILERYLQYGGADSEVCPSNNGRSYCCSH